MKRTPLLGIFAAAAIYAGGCGQQKESTPPAENKSTGTPVYKTVETTEKSDDDFMALMTQWQQEGWKVLSSSARSTNPDGTMHRTVKLRKP
jgi:hypothetical protein